MENCADRRDRSGNRGSHARLLRGQGEWRVRKTPLAPIVMAVCTDRGDADRR